MKKYTFAEGTDVSRGGKGIYEYDNGSCSLRITRNYRTFYLGMFPNRDAAEQARVAFLATLHTIPALPPKEYSTAWFKEQSDKQRILFSQRYFTNK